MTTIAAARDQDADLLEAAAQPLAPLFPPGFVYRPPLDTVCPSCGSKHTGFFQSCPTCQSAQAQRST